MTVRLFADAVASGVSASPITNAQTTVTLPSTAAFPVPSAGQQFSVIITDTPANPLAGNYEYQPVTTNNTGTNVLTFGGGVRAAYAGTTPKSYGAGATVALVLLAEDLTGAFARIDQSNSGLPASHYQGGGSAATLGALQSGVSSQSITGTDASGLVTVNTAGASPPGAGAVIAIVTFAVAWTSSPAVLLTPANNQLVGYSAAPATATFSIIANTGLTVSQQYKISYFVVGNPN